MDNSELLKQLNELREKIDILMREREEEYERSLLGEFGKQVEKSLCKDICVHVLDSNNDISMIGECTDICSLSTLSHICDNSIDENVRKRWEMYKKGISWIDYIQTIDNLKYYGYTGSRKVHTPITANFITQLINKYVKNEYTKCGCVNLLRLLERLNPENLFVQDVV